jgi:hypothetical protein
MEAGKELRIRIESWDTLSRWEQSELGRDLRRAGLSYGEIMGLIPVKKSTLATWCRGVMLSSEQVEAIKARTGSVAGLPRDTNRKRRAEIERIRAEAHDEAGGLIAQPLWIAGTVLYWGEGFKTQNQLGMANSDPHALRLFMNWCSEYHRPETGFRAKLNIHADNDELAAREWWAGQLSLTLDDFNKSFVKPDGTGHRKNHLPHGVCLVIKRKSADAFHRTLAWVEFLQYRMGQ